MISFRCNICNTPNDVQELPWEPASCSGCHSNARMRALVYLLSMEIFGRPLPLPEFPRIRAIRGLGLSDEPLYANVLAEKFSFHNTFYHQEPFLDITERHTGLYGTYDFILSSDVFEHVAPPVERFFEEASRLLKPDGFMCFTVPSSHVAQETEEYFPDLHKYAIVQLDGEYILINRKADSTLQIHRDLQFHGGCGATLVMRQFSQRDMVDRLRAAGFTEVQFQSESVERFGVALEGLWGRPVVARKGRFVIPSEGAPEADSLPTPDEAKPESDLLRLRRERDALESQLRLAAGSRWLRLGRCLGLGPKLE